MILSRSRESVLVWKSWYVYRLLDIQPENNLCLIYILHVITGINQFVNATTKITRRTRKTSGNKKGSKISSVSTHAKRSRSLHLSINPFNTTMLLIRICMNAYINDVLPDYKRSLCTGWFICKNQQIYKRGSLYATINEVNFIR